MHNNVLASILEVIICLILSVEWFCGKMIGSRQLLLLGVMLILFGGIFFSIGLIGDMLVDATYRLRYNEAHVKEKK